MFLSALLFLFPAFCPGGGEDCAAAEFDIDGPRLLLRRLQYCLNCGSALLVTRVHPGATIRCPDCGKEQARLADAHLLTQLHQLCRVCEAPLNPEGHSPGETVECGNCHTLQTLSRDAFPGKENASGLGYAPGSPPGSARKILLYSPDRPDGPITPAPLEDPTLPDLPPPILAGAARDIPRPPAAPPPALPPASAPVSDDAALTVPSVTTDLFGGKAPPVSGPARSGSKEAVLARVDGRPLYAADVDRIMAPVLARLREAAGPEGEKAVAAREKALRREVLERLVDRELAVREAEALGHKADPDAVRRREGELSLLFSGSGADLRREAERDVIMADMRARLAARPTTISPEAVREYYRLHRDRMPQPRQLALASLVVYQDRAGRADRRGYRDIAGEISRRLEQGESFDALRARYDEFAGTAGLEAIPAALQPESAYSARILEAAGDLRRGAVFGPLFMDGMALFGKVADDRPAGPLPFEAVEKEIRGRLEAEAAEKSLDDWLKGLRKKARLEYFD